MVKTVEERQALALELDTWFRNKGLIPAEVVSACINQIASHVAKDARDPEHFEKGKELIVASLLRRIDLAYDLKKKIFKGMGLSNG